MKASAWSNRLDPALVLAVITTWIGIVPRIVPQRFGDRGVFVSVAARLLAGDTLYSGVYDNKEPLFYYFVAGQLALGRWAEVAAEALSISIAATAAYFLAAKLASRWTAAAISFIAVPITLTGGFYFPGFTELPGIALVLAAITASAYGRLVLAGFCLGLLVFTKLIFVPVGLAGVGCFLLARRRYSDVIAIALGASVSTFVVVGILAMRRELLPYIETIRLNIAYSQGSLIASTGGPAGLAGHLRRIGGFRVLSPAVIPILLAMMLALIVHLGAHERNRMQLATAGVCVSTLVVSVAVLSLTGLWYNHTQILYISSITAALSLTSLLDVAAKRSRLATLALIILMGCLMAGPRALTKYTQSLQNFSETYAALNELSPEARRLLAIGNSGTYARFGINDNSGHAVGLRHWNLACPKFHQYPYESAAVLNKVFECASKAPTLLISENFAALSETEFDVQPTWNEFVARVERLIVENYSCDNDTGLRICKRHGN